MVEQQRFLEDVGMRDLPFPMRVASKADREGQQTVATISVNARIMREFEAGWIDKFIQIVHQHRAGIGTATLRSNIKDYLKELNASTVRVDFDYPFFIEKITPVTKEKCLVRYMCTFSAKVSSVAKPKVLFKIAVPAISTYPQSSLVVGNRAFGQLSIITIETDSDKEIYPEDMVSIVDKHALSPVYSFLTPEDQDFIIHKIHSEVKSSVTLVDEVKEELARDHDITWFSVRCANHGMLHAYSTLIGTEKSMWIPFTETDVAAVELL